MAFRHYLGRIRVGARSASENATLGSNVIFDGEERDFTREMRDLGVNVIFHRPHWFDRLRDARRIHKLERPNCMRTAVGAFMRLEIALIERRDEFVPYADCDILFLRDPRLEWRRPALFAACG